MRLINKISSKKLKELYWAQKISSPQIAKIYKCDPRNIRNLLRKYKIKLRTKSEARKLLFNISIPKKDLKKLYLKKKLSSPEIAREFNCSPGFVRNKLREYKIPLRSIQEALPLSNKSKYPQYDFNGSSKEKSYLIGLRLGDLYVKTYSNNSQTIFISTNSTKSELIQIIEDSFSSYGHIWKSKKPAKNNALCIRCSLNRSFKFLLPKRDLIEPWILKNKSCFAAFLAGYTDAEGTFCLCRGDAVFSIRSQDKNILHQIQAELIKLGILLRPPQIARKEGTKDIRGIVSNKDIWAIYMHRKDALLKLIDLLNPYLKHADKQKRIDTLKNNIRLRNKKYNRLCRSKWDKLYLKEKINYVRA
jgi:intein-encoded DNA endonuclease-like protein